MVPWKFFIHPQILERDDNVAAKESRKLSKVRRRGYVRMGEVNILTHYFSVTKGEDISMVYKGTYIGLNTSLWDPHFALPMAVSTLCAVEKGKFMADRDIGEMFLNFMLSEEFRPFCGVVQDASRKVQPPL